MSLYAFHLARARLSLRFRRTHDCEKVTDRWQRSPPAALAVWQGCQHMRPRAGRLTGTPCLHCGLGAAVRQDRSSALSFPAYGREHKCSVTHLTDSPWAAFLRESARAEASPINSLRVQRTPLILSAIRSKDRS